MSRQPPDSDQTLRRLTQLLGQDFVNYALGLPDGSTPAGEELTAAQKHAVQFLARQTQSGVDSDYGVSMPHSRQEVVSRRFGPRNQGGI